MHAKKCRSRWAIISGWKKTTNNVFQTGEIPDHLLEQYFELLTDLPLDQIGSRDRQNFSP